MRVAHSSRAEIDVLSPSSSDIATGVQLWTPRLGFFFMTIGGFGLGLVVPGKNMNPPPWDTISSILGWWYFLAWAISFVPQVVSNYSRKSVAGQSEDFVYLNCLGFCCYALYTVGFYYVPAVRAAYRERFRVDNNVAINDVAFALWACFWCFVNLFQIHTFGGGEGCSRGIRICIQLTTIGLVCWGGFIVSRGVSGLLSTGLNFLYACSFVKLIVTLTKYFPQIVLNRRRRSTSGWNIWNVLLDFTGGALSILQLVTDCSSTGDWSGVVGNPIKIVLGAVSIAFDIIFMVQHYYLYFQTHRFAGI